MQSLGPLINAIQWYEGMLLGPQHFQQFTMRQETNLCHILRLINPYFWGISHLKIDRLLLVSGKLRILQMEAILPDGTFLRVAPTDTHIPEVDLTTYADQFQTSGALMVYLALPLLNPNGSNLTGDFPRYLSVPNAAVVDINTGENPIYIPQLIPNISLLVSKDPPPPRYVSLPLMQIEFNNESYQQTSFLSPQIVVTQDSTLGQVISNILLHLRNKAAFLSENLQSNLTSSAQSLSYEYENILKIIVRKIPLLENLLGTNTTHPYIFYQDLLQLAGDLTALKRGQISPLFAPYQHDDIYTSFDQVISFIMGMIDLIQENYTALTFGKFDRVFSIELTPIMLTSTLLISLRGSSTFGPEDLAEWAKTTLIASESLLKNVRDRRILGAVRAVVENDTEFGISPPQNSILVSVTVDPAFILGGEPLCLINLSDTPETRPQDINLYVKNTAP